MHILIFKIILFCCLIESQVKEPLGGKNRNFICLYVPLRSLEYFTRTSQKQLPGRLWGRGRVESRNWEGGRVKYVTFHQLQYLFFLTHVN